MAFDAYTDLSRRLVSRLFVAGRIAVDHARFSALDGPSVFQNQYGTEVEATDVNGRVALVWDSRNNEYNPRTGFLLEGGLQGGRSGGASYTRLYTVMRGYLPLRPATVAAARFGASNMTGTPSFNSRFEIPTWENPMQVYGGYNSNRGYAGGRFVGSGVVFGSLELRQDFLPIGELASGMLIAFVDAGRVVRGRKLYAGREEAARSGGDRPRRAAPALDHLHRQPRQGQRGVAGLGGRELGVLGLGSWSSRLTALRSEPRASPAHQHRARNGIASSGVCTPLDTRPSACIWPVIESE